jgi:dienelactone hydrolase
MNLANYWGAALVSILALDGTLAAAQQRNATTPIPAGAHFVERELRIPVPGSGSAGVDALEVYINTPGKHPLALLTHGTSNDAKVRAHVTPWSYLPQARWFAEHGYVSLVIVRRGYGSSGGEMDGSYRNGCRTDDGFEIAGKAAADDLRNAVDYAARSMPEVDTNHVISSGVSTGGFTQVALTANPPRGLETAISFAGGRGGDGAGNLCNESGFEDALRDFGRHSHTPMLWIYAENDKWFPPNFARRFLSAFKSGGGSAEFVIAPPDGSDGHGLYSHPDAWSNTVQNYLGEHNLLPVDPPYPAPPVPNATPPAGLGPSGLAAFKLYLSLAPNKSFATNGSSWFGYSNGEPSAQDADRAALEYCNNARKSGPPCFVAYRGETAVNGRGSSDSTPRAEQHGGGRTGP